MTLLQKFCLRHCGANVDNLITVFDVLERNNYVNLDHVIAIILGLKDMVDEETLPKLSMPKKNGVECRLVRYNVLRDELEYEYDSTHRLWFQNPDDAEAYSNGENYYRMKYTFSEREDYVFPGERKFVDRDICSVQEWINNKVVVE